MKIIAIDQQLQSRYREIGHQSLLVHSVFEEACNLLTDEGLWMTIVLKHRWLPPNGMRVDHRRDLRAYFRQGERTTLPECHQDVRAVPLDLVSLTMNPGTKETLMNQSIKLDYIKAGLDHSGTPESLARRDLPLGIRESMKSLEESIRERNPEKLRRAASGLLGFGSGLTPSMDDYLTGRMLMLKAWTVMGDIGEWDYSSVISEEAKGRTTDAAQWMLRFAAEGRCSEEILSFLHTFFAKTSPSAFDDGVREVLEIGSTSGEDLMYGLWSEGARLMEKFEGGNREWD